MLKKKFNSHFGCSYSSTISRNHRHLQRHQDGLVLLTLRFVIFFKEVILFRLFLKNIFPSSSLCFCVDVLLVVKTFIFPVVAERFSTPLKLPTKPILHHQCTVAVAVVLLINLLRHLTL